MCVWPHLSQASSVRNFRTPNPTQPSRVPSQRRKKAGGRYFVQQLLAFFPPPLTSFPFFLSLSLWFLFMNTFDAPKNQKQLVHLYPQERISFPQRRNTFPDEAFLPPSTLPIAHSNPPSFDHSTDAQQAVDTLDLPQSSSDLNEVIYSYQSRPDLLKLILRSKLEEDKRRTEEARLRTKEIDLLLLQYKHMGIVSPSATSQSPHPHPHHHHHHSPPPLADYHTGIPLPTLPRSSTSTFNHVRENAVQPDDQPDPRMVTPTYWMDDEYERSSKSPIPSSLRAYQMSSTSRKHPLSPPLSSSNSIDERQSMTEHESIDGHRTRRRREMQPITNIIETTEFPYHDGYCWKNNGTNRKTGNKSIYYKCSSSNNGCPVNKTVLDRGNGTFIIKYRGEHLPECASVRQIFDSN
ncbi:hypothetical protein NQZ79_g1663 [Umbelopsis isabellina]|nr:hypothetical protein NQZ79_g1663 [Umbelopsis isabellina]